MPSRIEGSTYKSPMRAKDYTGKVRDFTDDEVRNRKYKKSGPLLAGVGIAQWTLKSRRNATLTTPGVTVDAASDAFLKGFEKPADQGEKVVQQRRANAREARDIYLCSKPWTVAPPKLIIIILE